MKLLKIFGYLSMPIDLFLGNFHWAYLLGPEIDEWYASDLCQAIRVSMWITLAGYSFWIMFSGMAIWNKIELPKALGATLLWYGICSYYDVIQTALASHNSSDPTCEILIFLTVAGVINAFFFLKDHYGSEKGTG